MTVRTRRLAMPFALIGALIALAAWAALALLSPVSASDRLIQAEPQQGATLAEAPHQLLLTFDHPLAQVRGLHIVEVTDSHGHRVDDGYAEISTYSQRTLIVPIHAEGDGTLDVNYRVWLLDEGESFPVASSYQFSVDHTLGPLEGEPVEVEAAAKSSQALVLWTIAILLGIAAAGALFYFLRMATGNARSSLEPTNRSVFRD